MLTISKYLIEKDIDSMQRGDGLMKLTPSVDCKEKHKKTKAFVLNAAGVRLLEKSVKDELRKQLLHDCMQENGTTRGRSATFKCDEVKKTEDDWAVVSRKEKTVQANRNKEIIDER